MKWYLFLAAAVIFNGTANVLMKAGMKNAPETLNAGSLIGHYLRSIPVMAGLVLFALNVLLYTQALTKIPLSTAYPLMVSLSGVIVIVGSSVLFKENISFIQWLGFALIIGGVFCVTR